MLHDERDTVILYPTQRDLRTHEIVIANVKLDENALNYGDTGAYVEAGMKIGITTESTFKKCDQGFLHVAMRRLNSAEVSIFLCSIDLLV